MIGKIKNQGLKSGKAFIIIDGIVSECGRLPIVVGSTRTEEKILGCSVCIGAKPLHLTVSLAETRSSRPSIRKISLPISEVSFQFTVLDYDLGLYGSFVICDFDFALKFRVLVFFNFLSVLKFLLSFIVFFAEFFVNLYVRGVLEAVLLHLEVKVEGRIKIRREEERCLSWWHFF